MGEKVGTRDLDDSELVDADGEGDDGGDGDDADAPISISSDDEPTANAVPKKAVIKQEPGMAKLGPLTHRVASDRLRTPTTRPRTSRTAPMDLLHTITRSLDPNARAARDDERTARSLQSTQLLALSNQLRDSQAAVEDLCNRLRDADCRADRAEMELTMERMTRGRQHGRSPSRRRDYRSPSHHRGDRRVRREIRYRSGGGSVTWVTPSDEERESAANGYRVDSDIEYQHYGTPSPHRNASRHRRSVSPIPYSSSQCPTRASADSGWHGHVWPASPFRSAMSGLNRPLFDRHPLDPAQSFSPSSASASRTLPVPSEVQVSLTLSRVRGPEISITVPPRHQQSQSRSHHSSPSRD